MPYAPPITEDAQVNLPDWVREVLACPCCGAAMEGVKCGACQRSFETKDGLPVLMPMDCEREVKFRFSPANSQADEATLMRMLRYPPLAEGLDEMPYHLDRAHAAILADRPPGRVLEIGCGGGQMRQWIERQGHQYVGIDVSTVRVHDWLRVHGGPDLLADAHFLPFQDESFDVVYAAAVTEHLANPFLVVQEVRRVLKPGGHYLGNCSFLESWHDNSYFHMTPLGVTELLRQASIDPLYIWPGRNYSGFYAVMRMGNKTTRQLRWLGSGAYMLYRTSNAMRDRVRGWTGGKKGIREFDAARVAGAIDWIAQRPA